MLQQMTWDEFEALLQANLPGFKRREIQAVLADTAMLSLNAKRHILAQAGCGTGKSFIAAFVSLMVSLSSGKPVAIATATKALQDQYAEKDLPFLSTILPELKFVVLKGRANYVCAAKVDELKDTDLRAQILAKTDDPTFSGELLDLGFEVVAADVASTSEECPGKKQCPFGDVCLSERAKTQAKTSHIVIVNHAVMAADMVVKEMQEFIGVPADKVSGILPQMGGVVIDEAHEFQDSVTNALGGSSTSGSFARTSKEIGNWFNDRTRTKAFDEAVKDLFTSIQGELNRREDKRSKTLLVTDSMLTRFIPAIKSLIDSIAKLQADMKSTQIHGNDKAVQQRTRMIRRLDSLIIKLISFRDSSDEELVRWLEVAEGKKGESMNWAPIMIDEFLRRNLWAKAPAMLMSATLSLGNDFSYVEEQLGLD